MATAEGPPAGMSPEAQVVFDEIMSMSGVQALKGIFEEEGKELRIVGGVCRDLLRGITPKDIDMATTAIPTAMVEFLLKRGIRVIETGLQHGTITAVIDKVEYEITTLRIDTDQDGRHCDVEYTEDWELDATRRDLTINAMSMGMDGTLYDYHDGFSHLAAKRIQFVGNAEARIVEDYLRILRYFRFHGRLITDVPTPDPGPTASHESTTLDAIAKHAHGLGGISGERIRVEMMKLMVGPTAGRLVRVMNETGVMANCRLPITGPMQDNFDRVAAFSTTFVTRLMTLVDTDEQWVALQERWTLSNPEKALGEYIKKHRSPEPYTLYGYEDLLVAFKKQKSTILEADQLKVVELALYQGQPELAATLREWDVPTFPISGKDVAGLVEKGPAIGQALTVMKQDWVASRFAKSKEDLLATFTAP